MATFTYTPDFPATETCRPRVNAYKSGSYEQRGTFGINPLVESWSVSFGDRAAADARAIASFLSGDESFTWTTPFGETAQFTCEQHTASPTYAGLITVAADFELTYIPGLQNIAQPAAPTSAFTFCPDYSGRRTYRPNATRVDAGDGYSQRLSFGLQPQTVEFQLAFDSRTNAERNLIRSYFRGAGGVTSFQWTDAVTGVSGKFVCQEWSTTYQAFNKNSIQAVFRQVFET